MKLSEYMLVCDFSKRITAHEVNSWIKLGWQPYFAPFEDSDGYYCQAMVKYEATECQKDNEKNNKTK